VTDEIAGVDSLFQEDSRQHGLLDRGRKRQLRKFYVDRAMRSHLFLSAGMGVVAAALPVLLLFFGWDSHGSISHYYYDPGPAARNILVGSLWATGMFLILFRGLSSVENHFLRLAGIFAVMVAMFPTPDPPIKDPSIHIVSAVLFFVCLAIVALFYSKSRICDIQSQAKKRFFLRAYNAAGAAMVGMPALVLAMHLIGGFESWIFWVETFGIWAFAGYWAVKTYEYRLLLGVRWRAAYTDDGAEVPPWRRRRGSRSAS
jgi:hypothetical membrane protein